MHLSPVRFILKRAQNRYTHTQKRELLCLLLLCIFNPWAIWPHTLYGPSTVNWTATKTLKALLIYIILAIKPNSLTSSSLVSNIKSGWNIQYNMSAFHILKINVLLRCEMLKSGLSFKLFSCSTYLCSSHGQRYIRFRSFGEWVGKLSVYQTCKRNRFIAMFR